MPINKNLQNFLETFDKQNPIQVRVMNMLVETISISDDFNEMISFLCHEQINHENLKMFLPPQAPQISQPVEQSGWRGTVISQKAVEEYESKKKQTELGSERDYSNSKRFKTKEPEEINVKSQVLNNGVNETPNNTYKNENENSTKKKEQETQVSDEYFRAILRVPQIITKQTAKQKNSVFFNNIYIPETSKNEERQNGAIDPSCLFQQVQCKLCGLRYPKEMTTEFEYHIEEHRRKNNALTDKIVLRREFFVAASSKRTVKLDLTIEGEVEEIPWNEEEPECLICGIKIQKKWDDEKEVWVLNDGTVVNDKECVHRKCVL